MKNKKKYKLLILVLLILSITIGYAALQSTLSINGTSTINNATWDVHWDNLQSYVKSMIKVKIVRREIDFELYMYIT